EIAAALEGGRNKEVRLIGTAHPLRTGFWVRKDTPMKTIGDLKGKRVPMGYSAMRVLDAMTRGALATANLTEKDVSLILVPNVVSGAEDLASAAADVFLFAFGGPYGREVEPTAFGRP